jgi:hypothetical protein
MENTIIDKVKDRIMKEKKKMILMKEAKGSRKDQYVVLRIDSHGVVKSIDNDWNGTVKTSFDVVGESNFITPVNIGKNITWIVMPEKEDDVITIENVVIKNSAGKQILRNRSYIRGNKHVVVGRVKNSNISPGDTQEYYLTYSVNGHAYVLDPIMEVHR